MSVFTYWPTKKTFAKQHVPTFEELARNPAQSEWKYVPSWDFLGMPRPVEDIAWFVELQCVLLDYQASEGIFETPVLFAMSDAMADSDSDTDTDMEIDISL